MDVDECIEYWKETGSTVFEAYVGNMLVEMTINNVTGEPEITINETNSYIDPEDLDCWNRY